MLLDPVLNFQISLMLRAKVFTCIFLHHGCHALRSNQRLNIISSSVLCSKMVSSVFQHSTISDSMVQELLMVFFSRSTLIDAMPFDFLLFFLLFDHHWCYAVRSSLQTSLMLCSNVQYSLQFSKTMEATLQDLPFTFSNIIDVTLQDLLFNFLTSLTLRYYVLRYFQLSDIMHAAH